MNGKAKPRKSHALLEQQKQHFEASQVVINTYFVSTHSHPTWISASAASLAVPGAFTDTEILPDMETSIILSGRTRIHSPFVVSVSEGIRGVITTLVQAAPLRWMSSFLTAELAVKICGLLPPRILATPIFYPLIWITNLTEVV